MRVGRRALVACGAVLAAAGAATFALSFTAFGAFFLGAGTGSSLYADRWRARLGPLPDPDAARAAYPEVAVKRFGDGGWVFGVSDDSHGSCWGGTVVLKDSSGRVRAFFGHVCGSQFIPQVLGTSKAASADDFYAALQDQPHWFREHPRP